MSRRAWLTPAESPDTFECREIFVPVGREWEAIFRGALLLLVQPHNFEQLDGITAEASARVFEETFYAWVREDCPMFAGMVVAAACAASPNPKWLICDGAAYAQADYPALYAAVGVTFGDDGVGTFRVPDLAGRLPLGVGSGSGLTVRALADSGGEETHQLTEAELASHFHYMGPINTGAVQSGAGTNAKLAVTPLAATSSVGDDHPHNNMPPYLALNFFIYAG